MPAGKAWPGGLPAASSAEASAGAGDGSTILCPGPAVGGDDTAIPAAGQGDLSRAGRAMGTPAFMPPEQARGLVGLVDERADVFSLGAILCVILTGRPPYQSPHWQDVLAQARRGDLAEALGRLEGCGADAELVALCRECLAAEREGRPRDAGVVAQRVAAYQAGVQGRLRQAELDRTQAQVRELERRKRRRLAGGLVAVLVAGLSVGLWAVGRAQARTAAALGEAEVNLRLARQAIDECFLVATKDPLFQEPRMEKARKLLLEKTLPFYKHFRAAKPSDPLLQRDEAKQWVRVAFIEEELGQPGRARQAYEQGLAMQQKLVQAHPGVPGYRSDLATTHNDLAVLLSRQKKFEEALAESRRARDLQLELVKANPAVPDYKNELARTHNVLAAQLSELGKKAEAADEYRRARDLGVELVKAHPGVLDYQD
ncbi:MAG: tetratricopeptide repeat-containing protein kinase family protein, partial [Gemmataceae bacterium]